MAAGVYAADGSINVTVVNGLALTGIYAPDGSYNVIADTTYLGVYHPCGAYRVKLTSSDVLSLRDPSGALYVTTNGSKGATRITVVSGSLGGGGGGSTNTATNWFNLLLGD